MNPFPRTPMGNTPILNTTRLILRPIQNSDAPQIYALRSDPDNFKYVDFTLYENLERAERFIKNASEDMCADTIHFWAICLPDTHLLIGTICLWQYAESPRRAEVGYEVMGTYQGNGYAGEALAEIIHFAFESLELEQILAITHTENLPSVALLNRFGFHRIGKMLDLDPNCGETESMMLYTLVSSHAFKPKVE